MNIIVGVDFFPALRSGVLVKAYFTLITATMYESGTCGGSGFSIFMVSTIFNSNFFIGYPDSNEIFVVEGGALRSVMILFAACFFKSSNFTSGKGY